MTRRRKNPEPALEGCEHCNEEVDPETLKEVTLSDETLERWCEKCFDADTSSCENCDTAIPSEDLGAVSVSGREKSWCHKCIDNDASTCERCDSTVDNNNTTSILVSYGRGNNTQIWCDSCARDNTFKCDRCEEVYSDEMNRNEVLGDTWCEKCTDNYANWCDRHEEYYVDTCGSCDEEPSDDDEDDDESALIGKAHSTRKRGFTLLQSPWVKAQPKPLYLGAEVEVEVPSGKNRHRYAETVRDSMGELLAGMEDDSSLDHGFEIITQPAGLDTHRETWINVKLKGLSSHDTKTCGLHVHFTRKAVSDMTLSKMLEFINAEENQIFMETLARRSFNEAATAHFAKRVVGLKVGSSTVKHMKERFGKSDTSYDPLRYEALNVSRSNTVEFRLPRGTTKITTILATLEFVYALIRFCEQSSMKNLTFERFKRMVAADPWLFDTRFLRAYMVDRGLSTAKEMRLPKLKPGAPPREDAPATQDAPAENPRSTSYAEQTLIEYRETGEPDWA